MTPLAPAGVSSDHDPVRPALAATYVAFAGAGISLATWASRIPQVRDQLELDPSELGFVLLAVAVGSLVSLPLAGPLVARAGSRRIVSLMATLFGVGLTGVGIGYQIGVVPVVLGLIVMGFGAGAWDVAMNVHGAHVEQELRRSIMSRFHAGFSLGTVAGALLGALMVAVGVSVTVHLIAIALVVSGSVVWASRSFLAEHVPPAAPQAGAGEERERTSSEAVPHRGHFAAWRESRTLLIGLFVLAFAFAEGVGNDWIAVAVIDGYGAPEAVGTFVFACFLAAMTLGRWFGPALLERYGRVPVLRVLALLGIVGTAVFVFSPVTWLAIVGAVLWGLGASLGFPVGMSAGADEPAFAAGRVSVVSTIGYCAFLVGPPLVGFLGDRFDVLSALMAVTALLAVSAAIAPVLEPRRTASSGHQDAIHS